MPTYLYRHPRTKKVVEVVQHMNDTHEYVDDKGVRYTRIFLSPRSNMDTIIDPFSKKDWMRKTAKKGMTVGDMMDESAGLSEQRARRTGVDPVKKKLFDAYTKKTGRPHPESIPRVIENKHVRIELD